MIRNIAAILAVGAATPVIAQPTIEDLTEIADISGLAASPDKRWVAFRVERPSIARNVIDLEWFIVAADGKSRPHRVGSGGIATWNSAGVVEPGQAIWMPDGRSFAVRAQIDGRIGVWSMSIHGRAAPLLVADADVERFAITPDGKLVAETGASRDAVKRAEANERDRGVLMDENVNLAGGIYRGAIVGNREASERWSGQWFDTVPLLSGKPLPVIVRDVLTGAEHSASAAERTLLAPAPPSPPAAAVAAAIATDGCDPKRACEPHRLSSSLALGDGRWALTTMDDRLGQSIYIWDGQQKHLRLLRAAPGLLNGGRSERSRCAAGKDALLCVEASADRPPRLVRIPLGGEPVEVMTAPNENLADDTLIVEPLAWQVGGSRASGWLLGPKVPGRLPLFVTYYRCAGYLRGGLGDEWPLRALAASGILTLCINALPIDGQRAEERYAAATNAVRTVVDMLDRRGRIDPHHVGMGGLSFGSEVTMWIAAHSDLLKAISIASVQIEPTYYWTNIIADRGRFAENLQQQWGLGSPDADKKRWDLLSPAANVSRIKAPVLMQMPEKEARLSPQLHARLIASGKGELHIFPFAPHIKVEPRQKYMVYRRNFDWFRYWLQGHIDPDPAKTEQYTRWGRLALDQSKAASVEQTQSSRSAISKSLK